MHAFDYSLTPSQSILNAPRAARLPNCIPLDTSLMAHALEALSGVVVSTICRTLALDYVGPQHGAPPPLTCCSSRSSRTPKPLCTACGAARFVEVKGPGDTMRDGQLAWIDVLVRAGAEVDVAYVQVG